MSTQPPDSAALEAAVDWRIRQESAALSAAEQQAFEHWLAAAPDHRAAWARVGSVLADPLATIRNLQAREEGLHVQAAMQGLFRARRRSLLRGALALGGMGVTAAITADRWLPLQELVADLHTGTGQREQFALDHGGTVLLDARSSANVHDGDGTTTLHLRTGALIAAPAPADAAPLHIRTRDGLVRLGTGKAMCRVHAAHTEVVAMEQPLVVRAFDGRQAIVPPGGGARVTAQAIERLHGNSLGRTLWQQGMVAAEDWPLQDLIAALQAYYPGFLRLSAPASRLRVFGIFRLDVDDLLATLAHTLPIQIRSLGPVISIDLDPLRQTGSNVDDKKS